MAIIKFFSGTYTMKMGYPFLLVTSHVVEEYGVGEVFLWTSKRSELQYNHSIRRRICIQKADLLAKLVSAGDKEPLNAETYTFQYTLNWGKANWENLKFLQWQKTHEDILIEKGTDFIEQVSWKAALAQAWWSGVPKEFIKILMDGTQVKELSNYLYSLQECVRPKDEEII